MPMKSVLRAFCLGALSLFVASAPARAGSAGQHLSIRLRVVLPLTHWTLINLGGDGGLGISLAGVSLGAELRHFWAFEAGGIEVLRSIDGARPDLFARAGIAPEVADWRRPDGRGWTAQLDALAGWRRLVEFESPDGHDGSEVTSGVTGSIGIELARHYARRAMLLRFLVGAMVPVTQTRTGYWADHVYFDKAMDLRYAIELSFDLGLAF